MNTVPWLGPHKGVVHLGLASVTMPAMICGQKKRSSLMEIVDDLSAEEIVNTLDCLILRRTNEEDALQLIQITWKEKRNVLQSPTMVIRVMTLLSVV